MQKEGLTNRAREPDHQWEAFDNSELRLTSGLSLHYVEKAFVLALKSSNLSHESTHPLKAKLIPVPRPSATDC